MAWSVENDLAEDSVEMDHPSSSDAADCSDPDSSPEDTSDSSTSEFDVQLLEDLQAKEQKLAIEKLVARSYQITLLEMAKVQNTIIFLPTGSGKTFVAVQLIKHYLREEKTKSDQIVVFLACSVPLVHQQAKYLRDHISPSFSKEDDIVMELTGDLNIDIYSKDSHQRPMWEIWMQKYKIFVMTAQIFSDCLNSANILWNNVSLTIFDECHNAVGDHCLVTIMKHYRLRKEEGYNPLPRILGLTATIINGGTTSTDKLEIKKNVKEIEYLFDARAVTHPDYEEVLAHSTNASTKYRYFKINPGTYSWNTKELTANLEYIQEFLKALEKSQFDDRQSRIKDIEHQSLSHAGQVFASNAKTVPQKLGSILKDITKILIDLGPYCARLACQIKRSYLLVAMEMEENDTIKYLLEMVDTALLELFHQLNEIMSSEIEDRQVLVFVSDKLLQLCMLLEETSTSQEPLCGLVFGEQRLTVQVLSWYFEHRAAVCAKSSHINASFVVGNASVGTDSEEARVTSAKQAKVIEKFRKKEYNLLFATKVLEEGINVPSCNVVIRFDDIQAYPSFVQSMGRARSPDASFHVFLEEAEARKRIMKLNRFVAFNKMLAECLRESVLHVDDDEAGGNDVGFPTEVTEEVVYCPGGTLDSPQLTKAEAISRVHRYCATLSCDRLATLAPVSWWKRYSDKMFKVYVLLPSNSAHREIIEGSVEKSKVDAKRAAFYDTCKILHQKGGLNDQFLPIPREIPPVIVGYLDEIEAECKNDGRAGKAGTNKKTKWYPKKVPGTILTASVRPDVVLNTYAIVIEQAEVVEAYQEEAQLYNFEHRQYLFGIVTSADFSKIKCFTLLTRNGTFLVTLKKIVFSNHTSRFTQEEILHLRAAQDLVFIHLAGLQLNSRFFEKVDAPFVITPIKKNIGGYEIDWEFSNMLITFDDTTISRPSEAERRKSIDLQKYRDAIVVPWHGTCPDPKAKYCVVEVLEDQSPQSSFAENPNKLKNYIEYYKEKHSLTPFNLDQPLLKCKQIGSRLNFLKHDSQKEKEKSKVLPRLIPEFCNLSPIPTSYYLQAKFLPSVIHRMFRLLMAGEIKESVARYFSWEAAFTDEKQQPERTQNIRVEDLHMSSDSETTPSSASKEATGERLIDTMSDSALEHTRVVKGQTSRQGSSHSQYEHASALPDDDPFHYEYTHPMKTTREELVQYAREKRKRKTQAPGTFAGHRPPPSKQALLGMSLINPADVHFESLDRCTDFHKESGPSTQTIMEALTLSSAQDSISLERLEIIGDSVLKLFVSQFIYTTYPEWQEGQMTNLRNKLVSNAHLYYFAKKNDLGEVLSGSIFNPEDSCWLPPGYTFNSNVAKVASKLGFTFSVFDQLSVEQVCKMDENALLEWVEVNVPEKKAKKSRTCYTHSEFGDKSVADSVEALIGAYFLNGGLDSAMRFMEWVGLRGPGPNGEKLTYGRPAPVALSYPDTKQTLIAPPSVVEDLENLIHYKFKNQWLLVEAFTHPGFRGNKTGAYQRLEFLGDAILDFLVTNHIYPMVNTPGKLTDLKSALVNNVTFGSLTVRYEFHKRLLSSAQVLQETIDKFVEYQTTWGHQVKGHYKLLNDMECILAEDVEVPKILGDLFESLAGAVYIDSGMSLDTVWKVFYRLMKNEIDIFAKEIPLSPIRDLHERFPGLIKFIDLSEKFTNDLGWIVMGVQVPKLQARVYGWGTNKKNAKAAAAKCAIKKLNDLELKEKQLASSL